MEAVFAIGWAVTVLGFLLYLREREAVTAQERTKLLNRIQAPAVAAFEPEDFEPSLDEPLFVEIEDPESVKEYDLDRRAGRTT